MSQTITKPIFVKRIQEMTGLPSPEMAESGMQIVLSLLSHRLSPEEARDVESQLAKDMKSVWNSQTWVDSFLSLFTRQQLKYRKKEVFYSMVEKELQKSGLNVGAEKLVMSVFHILKDQITEGEADDVAGQLPDDIRKIWHSA